MMPLCRAVGAALAGPAVVNLCTELQVADGSEDRRIHFATHVGGTPNADLTAEIGCWTAVAARGRGIAPAAVRAVTGWVFGAFSGASLRQIMLVHDAATRRPTVERRRPGTRSGSSARRIRRTGSPAGASICDWAADRAGGRAFQLAGARAGHSRPGGGQALAGTAVCAPAPAAYRQVVFACRGFPAHCARVCSPAGLRADEFVVPGTSAW
jgi:hypothetical protein